MSGRRHLVAVATTLALALGLAAVPAGAQTAGAGDPAGATPGLAEARRRANDAARRMNAIESELGGLDDEVTRLQADQQSAAGRLDDLRRQVQEFAVRRYTEVGQDPVLFRTDDINVEQRAEALQRIVTQGSSDAIDNYRATKARLERTERELAGKQADQQRRLDQLTAERATLDAELATLEAAEAQRQAEARRQAEQQAKEASDAAARQQAQQQAGQLQALQDATTAGKTGGVTTPPTSGGAPPPPPVASGSFVCPVQGPKTFVDSWLAPRPGGRRHMGVDLMSPRGTPVVIPVSGNVRLGDSGLGGLSFFLDGDDGNFYFGTHMDSYAGASGRLAAGTVVGWVGDSGDAKGTGTHLHFEIHIGGYGHPVDPYPTVVRYC